jgi:hypothetical protein
MSMLLSRARSQIILALLVSAVVACGDKQPTEPPDVTVRIQGSVVDRHTHLPIPGAGVELYRFRWSNRINWFEKETLATSTTGEGGEYILERRVTPCAEWEQLRLYATAPGYGDDHKSAHCTQTTQTIDLVLGKFPPSQ